jgi:hypothetical protein
MQPGRKHGAALQLEGVPCQGQEHSLSHILGKMRIHHHPQRGGMNQIEMTSHQFAKSRFGMAPGVIAK